MPEFGRHVYVEAVINEDEFGLAVGLPSDEDVTRVRLKRSVRSFVTKAKPS